MQEEGEKDVPSSTNQDSDSTYSITSSLPYMSCSERDAALRLQSLERSLSRANQMISDYAPSSSAMMAEISSSAVSDDIDHPNPSKNGHSPPDSANPVRYSKYEDVVQVIDEPAFVITSDQPTKDNNAKYQKITDLVPEYLVETGYNDPLRTHLVFTDTQGKPSPLPSKWNNKDKCSLIEILGSDLEARFVGPTDGREKDAACVRTDHPIPEYCGIYYYELKIISKGNKGYIGFGFSRKNVPIDRLPGWENDSWGYHGDDGHAFCCQGQGQPYGPTFTAGDVVGCGIDFLKNVGFFTKNGSFLGVAFKGIYGQLYPSVGMKTLGEHVQANFGQSAFAYNIKDYVLQSKSEVLNSIFSIPPMSIQAKTTESETNFEVSPCDEAEKSETMKALIKAYMVYYGSIEPLKAFQKEDDGSEASIEQLDSFRQATERCEIRTLIQNGKVTKAIEAIKQYFPDCWNNSTLVQFELRLFEFIELVKQTPPTSNPSPNEDKESSLPTALSEEIKDIPKLPDHLREALKCGQALFRDYIKSDMNEQMQQKLQMSFKLLAYNDPWQSPCSFLLRPQERDRLAEFLNSAILQSIGEDSESTLERLIQNTIVNLDKIEQSNDFSASLLHMQSDFFEI